MPARATRSASLASERWTSGAAAADIHIFTASKQPWVVLPEGTPAVPEYYDRKRYWPAQSLARREAMLARSTRAGAAPTR